ncbi:MAG: carbohydrate ABC transporter permease, partial [Propionicimonas sp.]|nr:carbohydrate ABC transporter permease [Propionicimonas sp.]
FLGYWNDYLWPLVMCQGAGCTLSAGLANFQGQYNYNYGVLMAGAVIAAVPILIAFLFAQKWIVRSIAYTGVRG